MAPPAGTIHTAGRRRGGPAGPPTARHSARRSEGNSEAPEEKRPISDVQMRHTSAETESNIHLKNKLSGDFDAKTLGCKRNGKRTGSMWVKNNTWRRRHKSVCTQSLISIRKRTHMDGQKHDVAIP